MRKVPRSLQSVSLHLLLSNFLLFFLKTCSQIRASSLALHVDCTHAKWGVNFLIIHLSFNFAFARRKFLIFSSESYGWLMGSDNTAYSVYFLHWITLINKHLNWKSLKWFFSQKLATRITMVHNRLITVYFYCTELIWLHVSTHTQHTHTHSTRVRARARAHTHTHTQLPLGELYAFLRPTVHVFNPTRRWQITLHHKCTHYARDFHKI